MKLVDQFYQVPGRCFFSGSSSVEGPILDTEHFVEGEGRVYIGPQFLEEACRLIGWRHPEAVELVEAENASLKARVAELEKSLDDKKVLEQAITNAAALIEKPPSTIFASPGAPSPFADRG